MDEERRKEYWATLALKHCPGLGARSQRRLLSFYGTALRAYEECGNWSEIGIKENIISAMKREKWRPAAQKEWNLTCRSSFAFILWSDICYPHLLKDLSDSPLLLYFCGDLSLLQSPGIAVVGSRNASAHGKDVAACIAQSIAAYGIAVISGMASGIDKAAHAASLPEIGKSIGVLGTGIDISYPRDNDMLFKLMKNKGLLISEFAPGTPPLANNFPIRNRIISGLSIACVVIEARKNSGSLITARYALEQDREIYVVPGAAMDANSGGCQDLVRQGAKPVFNAEDILEDLAEILKSFGNAAAEKCGQREKFPENPASSPGLEQEFKSVPVSPDKQQDMDAYQDFAPDASSGQILDLLTRTSSMTIDAISDTLHLDVECLNSILTDMEMLGQIQRLPGARIKLIK